MASVILNFSKENNEDKRVHFDASVDWEEEDRRSCRGVDSRRLKKEQKKMASEQKQERMMSVLAILRDEQYGDDIVALCKEQPFGPTVRTLIIAITGGTDDIEGEDEDGKLRRLLREFRSANKATLDNFEKAEVTALDYLMSFPPFTKKFKEVLPSTVITSGSEPSSQDNTPERPTRDAAKRRRHENQGRENVAKKASRIMGGPIPFVQATHHIKEGNDDEQD